VKELHPGELAGFVRRFGFKGGRVRRVSLRHADGELALRLQLRVRDSHGLSMLDEPRPVRLTIELRPLEEMRLQKRPLSQIGRLRAVRLGRLQGQFFVDLDPLSLEAGEIAGLHDFRASDCYFAARSLYWEVTPIESNGSAG
jgi:hypothetical protein